MNHSDTCSASTADIAAALLPNEDPATGRAIDTHGDPQPITRAEARSLLDALPGTLLTALARAVNDRQTAARVLAALCETARMNRLVSRVQTDEATLAFILDGCARAVGDALSFGPVLNAVEAADPRPWDEPTFSEYVRFGGRWYELGSRPTGDRGGPCGHDEHDGREISAEEVPSTLLRPDTDFFALPEAELKSAQAVVLLAALVHRTGSSQTAFKPETVALVADTLDHAPAIASACLRLGRTDHDFLVEVVTLARALPE